MIKFKILITLLYYGFASFSQGLEGINSDDKLIRSEVTADSKPVKAEFGLEIRTSKDDSSPIKTTFGTQVSKVKTPARFDKELELDEALSKAPISENDKSITYALFIGVSDYEFAQQGFGNLDKPVQDAQALRSLLLSKYQFKEEHSILLENPNKSEILKNIETLARKIDGNDNLLLFYAGHGYWDDFLKVGYWLANDAKIDDKSTWLSNSDLRDYISAIPSKHTILVTDACFGGGIFKTRAAENVNAYATSKLYQLPSRKALTSGTLTKVPDESVFIKYLLKRLSENNDPYLPLSQLFYSIRPAILNNSATVPQLGVIQNTGDEGGEFVFIKK